MRWARPVLKRFLGRRNGHDKAAHALYLTAVEQARQPHFYAALGVPDSLDGRFEMIVLHVYLILRSLRRHDDPAADIGQRLFDVMFADMDRSLREMGVADISVGKRIKQMAKAFYGRVAAYDAALSAPSTALEQALRRNAYGTAVPADGQVTTLADYLRGQAADLAEIPGERLLRGDFRFADRFGEATGKGIDR